MKGIQLWVVIIALLGAIVMYMYWTVKQFDLHPTILIDTTSVVDTANTN